MSLLRVLDIAVTGLSAQSLRLNLTASNLANADSVSSSTARTYRAREPIFVATAVSPGDDQDAVGVRMMGVVENQAPLRMEYRPEHPLADDKGYVYLPNVNVIEEMANMISASRSYATNVEVINTAKQLLLKTLQLGQ
jgi:flagellar basal-body rod protein FlgC